MPRLMQDAESALSSAVVSLLPHLILHNVHPSVLKKMTFVLFLFIYLVHVTVRAPLKLQDGQVISTMRVLISAFT